MPLCAKRLVLAGGRLARFCARRRSERGRCVVCCVRGAGCAKHLRSALRAPGPRWTAQLTLNVHTTQTKKGALGRVVDFAAEGYSAERAPALIAALVASVRPDLVIFTGAHNIRARASLCTRAPGGVNDFCMLRKHAGRSSLVANPLIPGSHLVSISHNAMLTPVRATLRRRHPGRPAVRRKRGSNEPSRSGGDVVRIPRSRML